MFTLVFLVGNISNYNWLSFERFSNQVIAFIFIHDQVALCQRSMLQGLWLKIQLKIKKVKNYLYNFLGVGLWRMWRAFIQELGALTPENLVGRWCWRAYSIIGECLQKIATEILLAKTSQTQSSASRQSQGRSNASSGSSLVGWE